VGDFIETPFHEIRPPGLTRCEDGGVGNINYRWEARVHPKRQGIRVGMQRFKVCVGFAVIFGLAAFHLNAAPADVWQPQLTTKPPLSVFLRTISEFAADIFWRGAEKMGSPPRLTPIEHPEYFIQVNDEERAAYVAQAQLWQPTDIAKLTPDSVKAGEKTSLHNDAEIRCDYVPRTTDQLGGTTPKFECRGSDGHVYRVKYGKPKAFTSVAASRLFWALGYGADITTPVKIRCHGCSSDPWTKPQKVDTDAYFPNAIVQQLQPGKEITLRGQAEVGWSWQLDLPLVSEEMGGATKAEVDGLVLLAAMIQHGDSKSSQQKLICRDEESDAGTDSCSRPYMYIHDLGNTFGSDGVRTHPLDFERWAAKRVWKDSRTCIADIRQNFGNGGDGLQYPKISEAGRAFLAGLLSQLIANRANVVAIFEAAHMEEADGRHSAQAWADVLIEKAQQVINHPRCPD